jgi:hypothetical protein
VSGESRKANKPQSGFSLVGEGLQALDSRVRGVLKAAVGSFCDRETEGLVARLGDGAHSEPVGRPAIAQTPFPCLTTPPPTQ